MDLQKQLKDMAERGEWERARDIAYRMTVGYERAAAAMYAAGRRVQLASGGRLSPVVLISRDGSQERDEDGNLRWGGIRAYIRKHMRMLEGYRKWRGFTIRLERYQYSEPVQKMIERLT